MAKGRLIAPFARTGSNNGAMSKRQDKKKSALSIASLESQAIHQRESDIGMPISRMMKLANANRRIIDKSRAIVAESRELLKRMDRAGIFADPSYMDFGEIERGTRTDFLAQAATDDLEKKFARAAWHVAQGKEIIERQRERVERLKATGRPALDAERTLNLFIRTQKLFEDHGRKLRNEANKQMEETISA